MFEELNLDTQFAKAELSKKNIGADYQVNAALALSKILKKNPMEIANELSEKISQIDIFEKVEVCPPGFINLTLKQEFIQKYIRELKNDKHIGIKMEEKPKNIVVDYGGANVAKPLHVGHLRSAVIGDAIKRLLRRKGNNVTSDIHLGDFGLQMGLTICELIDEGIENNFNISDLEKAYPQASIKAKETNEDGTLKNPDFANRSHEVTRLLQEEKEPYYSIWKNIVKISIDDLKKNYDALGVQFDLWNGEACVNKYIPDLIKNLIDKKIAVESEGALVVPVSEENDKKEIPPCIIRKSDGAILYATTDLATIIDREINLSPDEYIYVTDIRQALHFVQVFRAAKKAKLVRNDVKMVHIGFGTMNGKDGKPFKTRDGGVLRLEKLLNDVTKEARSKLPEEYGDDIAKKVAISALKYGDLSNIASKDYIFDIDKFVSFEGNTGPYILYTIVRINSILNKLEIKHETFSKTCDMIENITPVTKNLELLTAIYPEEFDNAYEELALHKLCAYIYNLSNAFNSFYHEHHIASEENENTKNFYINLLIVVRKILIDVICILGFEEAEKM